MKKFRVTWVYKAYCVVTVEAESFEQAEAMIEADFDSFFMNKTPVDYDNEVFYDEVEE
jgi:nicotinate-nucleotide pyrophosphorylase